MEYVPSKERMIKVTIAITFVLLVCIAGVMLASVLKKSSSSNNSFLQNKGNNDDLLLVQEIKWKKENGPCTFLIERHIVIKYHISSWALNDADDGPECIVNMI